MRSAPKRTTNNAKSITQSGRESFETVAMVIDTEADVDTDVDTYGDGDGDGDDGDLSEDDISAFPI